MLGKLLEKAKAPPPVLPAVADGHRIYAVGDIHGRADLLAEMHAAIREDAADHQANRRVVIYLGDYIDRGMESRAVIDMLLDEPLAEFERVHLKGNHEALMLDFLGNAEAGPGWLMNGGLQTLASYGVAPESAAMSRVALEAMREALAEALPQRHLDFLSSLQLVHVEGDYAFVHAGIRPGTPIERQSETDLLWIREAFLDSRANHGKVVVHGHTIAWEPEVLTNRIGIDTGAFASGVLSALVLQGESQEILQT